MTRGVVASVRRTSLMTTFGIGAIVPTEDDSVMVCGLDDWSRGPLIVEPRLSRSLGVYELRAPRAREKNDIPATRFPEWAFCPQCRRLGPAWVIADDGHCKSCDSRISPSRFVACCEAGHIEDFPYLSWVHEGPTDFTGHDLYLDARGKSSALSDLVVRCSCGKTRSMDGSFGLAGLRGVASCHGNRPWLPEANRVPCDKALRTLQRGSSNVWFSVTRSVISIPSVRSRIDEFVEQRFKDVSPDADPDMVASWFPPPPGISKKDVADALRRKLTGAVGGVVTSVHELRAEEYRALVNGLTSGEGTDQFLCEEVELTGSGVPEIIAQVSRVSRLREVSALHGFTRVLPPVGEETVVAPISASPPTWLPAIETLGEGVFVRVDEDLLKEWCDSPFARSRVDMLEQAAKATSSSSFHLKEPVNARALALHSLAHLLVDEFSLDAGYPAASLRERVYDAEGQAGILIYTATADSAGSLGGLAAQSDPDRFREVLASALHNARWCTADPVCIESQGSGVGGGNLAACHACLLLPETSCERFNLGLDRAALVGTLEQPEDGLFGSGVES